MKNIFKILIIILALTLARVSFAQITSPVLTSIVHPNGDWDLVNLSGVAIDPCVMGVQSWKKYINGVFDDQAPSFICSGTPWAAAATLTGHPPGTTIQYDFFTGTSFGGNNIGHIGLLFLDSGYTPELATSTTRFLSLLPINGNTVGTTTNVGASIYANTSDFPTYGRLKISFYQDGAMSCINSGAVIDAVTTCAGSNSPKDPFQVTFDDTVDRLLSGNYQLSKSITFPGGGKWNATYEIQLVGKPWYYLGLVNSYETIVATTSQVVIGQLSPIDIVRDIISSSTEAARRLADQGIGSILASTTASVAKSCNIISSMFSIGDCLTLLVWPGNIAMDDNITILKQLPPFGYAFRFYDILNSDIASTSLPIISYDFPSNSPFASVGNVHFDPFGLIRDSGTLISEMTSDRPDHLTVWQIMEAPIKMFVYLVLFSMIIHDITGVYNHAMYEKRKNQ